MFSYVDLILIGLLVLLTTLIGAYIGFLYGRNYKFSLSKYEGKKQVKCNSEEKNNTLDIETTNIRIRQSIINKMEMLQEKTNVDFIGLGLYDVVTEEIRWRIAVGASNTRYKKIVIRMGKGIAGETVQLNRTVKIEDYPNDVLGDPIEYPILMVEHLCSVIAVPVVNEFRVFGVLLIGQRTKRTFTDEDEYFTKLIAKEIGRELELANIYSRILHDSADGKAEIKENINDSIFVQYLIQQEKLLLTNNRGKLYFEVLDQSIVEMPANIQEKLITSMEEILEIVNKQETDQIAISILRDESNLLVECKINRSIPDTKEVFESIYLRIGGIGGSIITFHEDDSLHFMMQIPLWNNRKSLV